MSDSSKTPRPPTSIATPKLKRGIKGYFADIKREMKKVVWPSRKETNRLTGVVVALVIVIAFLLVGFGWVADIIISIITTGKV